MNAGDPNQIITNARPELKSITDSVSLALDPNVYYAYSYHSSLPSYTIPYGRVPIYGTRTEQYMDLHNTFKINREYYFDTKKYEAQYHMSSKDMFKKWKKGQLSSPDYSEWVNAYITIWDKVYAPGYPD
jgi:hypothetical protein